MAYMTTSHLVTLYHITLPTIGNHLIQLSAFASVLTVCFSLHRPSKREGKTMRGRTLLILLTTITLGSQEMVNTRVGDEIISLLLLLLQPLRKEYAALMCFGCADTSVSCAL